MAKDKCREEIQKRRIASNPLLPYPFLSATAPSPKYQNDGSVNPHVRDSAYCMRHERSALNWEKGKEPNECH
jgi:hypothetical protein